MRCDYRRVRPGLSTIRTANRIDRELCKLLAVLVKATIIMEKREMIAILEANSTAHRDDTAVISNSPELSERTTIIFRNSRPHWKKPTEHHETLLAIRARKAKQRRTLAARRPV